MELEHEGDVMSAESPKKRRVQTIEQLMMAKSMDQEYDNDEDSKSEVRLDGDENF